MANPIKIVIDSYKESGKWNTTHELEVFPDEINGVTVIDTASIINWVQKELPYLATSDYTFTAEQKGEKGNLLNKRLVINY